MPARSRRGCIVVCGRRKRRALVLLLALTLVLSACASAVAPAPTGPTVPAECTRPGKESGPSPVPVPVNLAITPAVSANGVVYVVYFSATSPTESPAAMHLSLAALHASDGTLLWQRTLPLALDPIAVEPGSLILLLAGDVLLLSSDRFFAGLRASDGMLLWQVPRNQSARALRWRREASSTLWTSSGSMRCA